MVDDQWCLNIKINCFCFTLTLSYFLFKLKFTLRNFSVKRKRQMREGV